MFMDRRYPVCVILLFSFHLQSATAWQTLPTVQVGPLNGGRIAVSTNQVLNPAGKRIEMPYQRIVDVAVNPAGDLVAVAMQSAVGLYTVDGRLLARIELTQNTSMKGLAFSPDGKLLAVAQAQGCVSLIDVAKASQKSCLAIPAGALATGLTFDAAGGNLFVALSTWNTVAKIDLASAKIVTGADVGTAPLGVALSVDGKRLFVTNLGGPKPDAAADAATSNGTRISVDGDGVANAGSVSVIDTATFQTIAEIPVGLHPSSLAVSPDGLTVAVANSNSDSVSVLSTGSLSVTSTVPMPSIPVGTAGASPTGLTYSKDGSRLYVTLGGANAVAAFDVAGQGYILRGLAPTDWYPIAIDSAKSANGEDILFVANNKGLGTRAGSGGLGVRDTVGTMNIIRSNSIGEDSTVAATEASNPFDRAPVVFPLAGGGAAEAPADLRALGVEHVFLIVKENRTYDQVLGDVKAGNGDPNLAIYGWRVTPNQHSLAQNFVLFDNYYASGTVSADGHQWITQATATAYAERQYSAQWPRSYPYSGEDPLIFASTGFIWGNAMRHGLTARVFGEFAVATAGYPGTWNDYLNASATGTPTLPTPSISPIASMNALHAHNYPAFNLNVSDTYRARLVLDEIEQWEAKGNAPNLVIIQLPADHTVGTTPGAPTPQAMVADNDVAVARIVEAVSHSSLWAKSAIFVTEDDAQDGVDHVDGHRTTCYLASPFAKRGVVDSTYYNHTALIRTIEELLGLPPMNRFDATAIPMRAAFTSTPDSTQFDAMMSSVPLDQKNPRLSALSGSAKKAAMDSLAMNFRVPDAAPEKKLNRILWHQATAWGAKYPKPPHKKTCPKDADD